MVKFVEMQENGSLTVNETDEPSLKDGEILLETIYSELCGTDVHLKHGRLSGVPYPIIPGHVSVGKVIKVKGKVLDVLGKPVELGKNIVFLDVHETCNSCYYCLVAKASTKCPHRKVYGITYSSKDGLHGGWSEQILLRSGVKTIVLPDDFPPRLFIAGGCGLPTAIHAVQRANIPLGSTVLVQGSGPVGLSVAILAKLSGAYTTIMTGAPQHRLETAKLFGIDHTINIDQTPLEQRIELVYELSEGRGVDRTIEATGNPSAVSEGIKMTRNSGRMVVAGHYTDTGAIQFNPHTDLNKKHLALVGSWGSDFSHFYLAVQTLIKYQNLYPWEKMISKEYSLEDLSTALNDLESLKILKGVVNPNIK